MSDCWVVGSGAAAADDDPFGEAPGPTPAPAPGLIEDNDGLTPLPRPEAAWAGTAEGVNGIEGGWMVTPFIPSGRVVSNAPVPKKECTTMVSDRILAGYPALNALFFFFFFFQWSAKRGRGLNDGLTETPRELPPR